MVRACVGLDPRPLFLDSPRLLHGPPLVWAGPAPEARARPRGVPDRPLTQGGARRALSGVGGVHRQGWRTGGREGPEPGATGVVQAPPRPV